MSSDKKIHEPGTSWCLGYSRTRRRDTHNNTARHLNFFRYKTCKTLKHNNGEVFGSDNYLWSWGSDTARKMRRVSFPSNAQLKAGLGCDSGFGRNTRTVSCENHCNTRQLKVEMIRGKQNWGPSRAKWSICRAHSQNFWKAEKRLMTPAFAKGISGVRCPYLAKFKYFLM